MELADYYQIEKISAYQWPGISSIMLDGWLLHFADGFTKRANCVHPISLSTLSSTVTPVTSSIKSLEEKIDTCEKLYREKQLPTIFKLTSFVFPAHLDKTLEARQYKKESGVVILTIPLKESEESITTHTHANLDATSNTLAILNNTNDAWLQFHGSINHYSDAQLQSMNDIIQSIKHKKVIITLSVDGKIVSGGIGVVDGQYLGIYCLATAAVHRGNGYASTIMKQLFKWGQEQGAVNSFIQVESNNEPALKLYDRLGYRFQYEYWYRIKNN